MKIKITIGGQDGTALILPIECAGLAAEVLAKGTVYQRDGYYSTSGWKKSEDGVRIEYTEAAELEPTHPKVAEAQKETEQHRKYWMDECSKTRKLEKELAESKAALAALQSVTTCTVAEPAPDADDVVDAEIHQGTEVEL